MDKTNWRTTVFGTGAAVLTALCAVPQFSEYKEILAGFAAVLGALFAYNAKDKVVTGGKIKQ